MTKNASNPQNDSTEVFDLDKRHLLVRHANGDQEAFVELMSLYRRKVYGYLVHCGIDTFDRDDLFQDIFLKIHASAPMFRRDHHLEPWIFTIVANTVRSFYRRRYVRRIVQYDETPAGQMVEPQKTHDMLEANETGKWLAKSIQQLPFCQREAILLSAKTGMNQKQIAQVLDIPVSTLKTYLRRARMFLAKQFEHRKEKLDQEALK